ncbi:hypothetical protein CXB49_04450 [Chromobacterium sp. ATCC 53434]|uniref:hypothetical protein n=1 Tax=Chromobacterium sp. (strain ATCC 53434 / SC 14030) TaxID=2059672 RepID=UPI000C77B837|nr:hypothetical protein [Chromobacterium sp. ATCC 53434]AUH50121.1 hypothetical protein CXB49_04450 [Chromobacterium sp. ATCC 53434]
MKTPLIAFALSVLSFSAVSRADDAAPPDDFARIRIFQQNGVALGLFPGRDCYRFSLLGNHRGIVESQAFKSFLHLASNKSIGMPETPNSRGLSARSTLFSAAYYQEYRLPAGKITTLTAAFNDVGGWRCDTQAVKFTPQAGTDYEAMLDVSLDDKTCRLVIGGIPPDQPEAGLQALADLAPACSSGK